MNWTCLSFLVAAGCCFDCVRSVARDARSPRVRANIPPAITLATMLLVAAVGVGMLAAAYLSAT